MMATRKKRRFDQIFVGWSIGIIVPLIIFLGVYQVEFSDLDFREYLRYTWQAKIMMKLLSLCVFPNLAFFFIFYRMKYDMAARGVILATFMYAFAVLVAKLI